MERRKCCQNWAYLESKQDTGEENEAAISVPVIFPPKHSLLIGRLMALWLERETKSKTHFLLCCRESNLSLPVSYIEPLQGGHLIYRQNILLPCTKNNSYKCM